MLQEIKGFNKSQIIKEYNIKNEVIEVVYLDGSKDVFEMTPSVLKKIIEKMEIQAKQFVSRYDNEKTIEEIEARKQMAKMLMIIFGIAGVGATYLCSSCVSLPITIYAGAATVAFEGYLLSKYNRFCGMKEDIQKYSIYIKNKEDLEEEYSRIITKEQSIKKSFIKPRSAQEVNVNTLDTFTKEELELILEKIERYNEIAKEENGINTLVLDDGKDRGQYIK